LFDKLILCVCVCVCVDIQKFDVVYNSTVEESQNPEITIVMIITVKHSSVYAQSIERNCA